MMRPTAAQLAAALEKLGASGALYSRALAGATQRGGGRIAPQLLEQIAAQPRATRLPGLADTARAPGAIAPTLEQTQAQRIMRRTPWAGTDSPNQSPFAQSMFNKVLQHQGKAYPGVPGAEQEIIKQFGTPYGHSGSGSLPFADTARAQTLDPTRPGKKQII